MRRLLLAGSGFAYSFSPVALGRAARSARLLPFSAAASRSLSSSLAGDSEDDSKRFSEAVYNKRGDQGGPVKLEKTDLQLLALINWHKSKRINLKPKYQRAFTWKEDRASRLIVTALMGRYIPAIMLHEREGVMCKTSGRRAASTFDVVDGKQRLSSLLAFYHGKDATDNSLPAQASQLSKLPEEYETFNGMQFVSLAAELKSQFTDFPIITLTIPVNMPAEQVFGIYEDINR
jgi:hypothetical protein